MNIKPIVYFPNLNSLRAMAALAVILNHLTTWFVFPETPFYNSLRILLSFGGNGGRFGVIFFFILSGFLITYLLFLEQERNKQINITHFYFRRILRIWPLYYLSIAIGFIVYPTLIQLTGSSLSETANWILYLCFAANFDHIYGLPPTVGILGVQWSVAVEEQFYLVWPIIFALFGRTRLFHWLLIAIILAGETFFLEIARFQPGRDYHLFNCFRFLSFGGLLAYFCFNYPQKCSDLLKITGARLTKFIYFICISLMICRKLVIDRFPYYANLDDIIPSLFFGFIIVEQNFSECSFFKFGKIRILNWLGKISYGLYLLHMIVIYFVFFILSNLPEYIFLKLILSLALTILVSHLSYVYFERYFLDIKDRVFLPSTTPSGISP